MNNDPGRVVRGHGMQAKPALREVCFVHRCNGEIDEFRSVRVVLTQDSILIEQEEEVVAIYARHEVYLASHEPMTPPVMF